MVLVDTSVWVEVLRKAKPLHLETQVDLDDVVTCLPVVQEVLQGIDREEAFRLAREAMWALPIAESPMRPDIIEGATTALRQPARCQRRRPRVQDGSAAARQHPGTRATRRGR